MNEELRSANAEQEEIDHELTVRTKQVEQINAYVCSILRNIQVGAVVVSTELDVEIWNEQAFQLRVLREDEVVLMEPAGHATREATA